MARHCRDAYGRPSGVQGNGIAPDVDGDDAAGTARPIADSMLTKYCNYTRKIIKWS